MDAPQERTENHDIAPLSFDNVGVRNSQKRLKELIDEVAIEPLKGYPDQLLGDFDRIEHLVMTRIARVITHWAQHKHEPLVPRIDDKMSDITNARRSDATLESFYKNEVETAMHVLASLLSINVPASYVVPTDELEFALLELEETFEHDGGTPRLEPDGDDYDEYGYDDEYDAEDEPQMPTTASRSSAKPVNGGDTYQNGYAPDTDNLADLLDDDELDGLAAELTQQTQEAEVVPQTEPAAPRRPESTPAQQQPPPHESHIVPQQEEPPVEIESNVLNMPAEEAWHTVYGLMGYQSEYIQAKMLPRWKEHPELFQSDRRFMYRTFIQSLRNATGKQSIGGHFIFEDRRMTVDQLWNYYYTDLSQNVGPILSAAALEAEVNAPWWKRARKWLRTNLKNVSPIWLLALVIALVFDGLTTYVSLDQTPMDGVMVLVFTALITALFQIADVLVINYRKREFESDALIAKYHAKVDRLDNMLKGLQPTSDSFVQLSMERSQANADWKAAEDNRKMARRGRYWSARIADINILVTAYGFAYMFLNAEEPMGAFVEQMNIIFIQQAWASVNLWVFLMIGLAITVSFVINTAQRTEILGWSLRRLKNEA